MLGKIWNASVFDMICHSFSWKTVMESSQRILDFHSKHLHPFYSFECLESGAIQKCFRNIWRFEAATHALWMNPSFGELQVFQFNSIIGFRLKLMTNSEDLLDQQIKSDPLVFLAMRLKWCWFFTRLHFNRIKLNWIQSIKLSLNLAIANELWQQEKYPPNMKINVVACKMLWRMGITKWHARNRMLRGQFNSKIIQSQLLIVIPINFLTYFICHIWHDSLEDGAPFTSSSCFQHIFHSDEPIGSNR